MENAQAQTMVPASTIRALNIFNIIVMGLMMLIPIINLLLGTKILTALIGDAVLKGRFLRLLTALLVSVPVGLFVSWAGVAVFDSWRNWAAAVALYAFVVGPAAAAVVGQVSLIWPAGNE